MERSEKLNEQSGLTEEDLVEKVTIDVPMPIHYIRKDLVQELSLLEPFGKGNEKPLFAQKICGSARCVCSGRTGTW